TDGSGIINISVNDNSNESLSISLNDLLGNTILTQNIGAVPGINYFQMNPKDLPQGIYFITVSNSKKRLAAKVIY
ncbi:MAG: T9SS type A sorting domain-containing protein, partial [Bacteroidota bacterium]